MSYCRETTRKTVGRVIRQYDEMVNKEMKQLEKLTVEEIAVVTVDKLKAWDRADKARLRKQSNVYVSRLLDLYELILPLTDERFVVLAGVRAVCLEYLLWEMNEIIMDLVGFVQMGD